MKIHTLGLQPYESILEKMRHFTIQREASTEDECWMLEHPPVFTQGVAGRKEHILNPLNIPVVQSDRGGQVTYHGPGQLVVYFLVDLKPRKIGIRTFVKTLEKMLSDLLRYYGLVPEIKCGAPGVYIQEKKIASIGLRVKNACTYHGIALNVAMDLTPFKGIHPCGFDTLEMTEMRSYIPNISVIDVSNHFKNIIMQHFSL